MAQVLIPLSRRGGRTDISDCKACGSVPSASEASSLSGVLQNQELKLSLSSLETSSSAKPRPRTRHCLLRSERILTGQIAHASDEHPPSAPIEEQLILTSLVARWQR